MQSSVLDAILCEYTLERGIQKIKQKYLQPEDGGTCKRNSILGGVLCEYTPERGIKTIKQKYLQLKNGRNAKETMY